MEVSKQKHFPLPCRACCIGGILLIQQEKRNRMTIQRQLFSPSVHTLPFFCMNSHQHTVKKSLPVEMLLFLNNFVENKFASVGLLK